MLSVSQVATAQAPLVDNLGGPAGFGPADSCLGRNDDQSSPTAIDLSSVFPNGLRFFDRTHNSMYVNSNGNITFGNPVSIYTPNPFPVANQPMIAPYWADVDTRRQNGACMTPDIAVCENPTDNGVWWSVTPERVVVTWDNVMFYSCGASHPERRMAFQIILTPAVDCDANGDFDVEFRYNRCEWESGTASGGDSGGFGGTEAQVGFDAGNRRDFLLVPGSREAGIAQIMCTRSNVGAPGVWRFRVRSGIPVCPGGGTACDTGQLGVCRNGVAQCRALQGFTTACVPTAAASPEVCDGLDNNCDGDTDEGALCADGSVCSQGQCRPRCSTQTCAPGLVCDVRTEQCVEPGCEVLTCDLGRTCRSTSGPNGPMGVCEDACAAVRCPDTQVCRGGACVDACAGVQCDACAICVAGQCTQRCVDGGCLAGETCELGRCRDAACAIVTCPVAQVCRAGNCVDACDGVICPTGRFCVAGQCRLGGGGQDGGVVDAGTVDASNSGDSAVLDASTLDSTWVDSRVDFDATTSLEDAALEDASSIDGSIADATVTETDGATTRDAGVTNDVGAPTTASGCSCDTQGRSHAGSTFAGLYLFLLAVFSSRRFWKSR